MSKTLELLEELKKPHYVDGRLPLFDKCRFDKIEQELKALDIIKEKNVLINWLKRSDSLEMYNQMCYEEIIPLTQKEYGLLKEVLL